MNHRIHRSDEEWMQLITSCRQSGLSDKEWCVSNGIVVSSFYNAVVRLRKKACQIPEHEQNAERIYDLTASSLPDVVPISVIQDQLQMNLSESSLFLFCGRRCDKIKALLKKTDGYFLICKHLTTQL